MADEEANGCVMVIIVAVCAAIASMILTESIIAGSWRKWAIERGVAEYDSQTGKWREIPCKCEGAK